MPTIAINTPANGQNVVAGPLSVVGSASGVGGAEPSPIVSVTVNGVSATLVHSQSGPSVGFSATIQVRASTSDGGAVAINAQATDDAGRKAGTSISVNVSGSLPIFPGQSFSNYPKTLSETPLFDCYPQSLRDIADIVRAAEAAGKKVHALGSVFSFSDCWMTSDYSVDTGALNKPIQTVQKALTSGAPRHVYHVEAGIHIWKCYENLDALGLALETMGGASGQTLAGAISTGTHGGDYRMGPLADSVLAIHLVGAGGTEYWIEPSSPITDPALLRSSVVPQIDPANIIYDDEIFNACLVSVGCMGIIYAVVLRVWPSYDLAETTKESTWNDFIKAAPGMLSNTSQRFLQVAIDPYADSSGNNKCIITTRTEPPPPLTGPGSRPYGDPAQAVQDMIGSMNLADQGILFVAGIKDIPNEPISDPQKMVKVAQLVLTWTPVEWSVMAEHYWNILLELWPAKPFSGSSFSVMDTTYGKPDPAPSGDPTYSIELFFPATLAGGKLGFADFVNAALAKINAATSTFLVGYVSLRFTGATRAFLGMQQWNPTCAVEIAIAQGVQNDIQLLTDILNMGYQYGGIPHWGQLIDRGIQGSAAMYPGYGQWRKAYAKLSNNFTARTFENSLSSRWQLTSPSIVELLLRDEAGNIYVIFGGARFHVPDPATLNRLYPGAPVYQWLNGAFDRLPTTPADSTLLRDENGAIAVIFGGARFHVPDPATLNRLYSGAPISQLWNGAFDYIPTIPADGTLLRDETGKINVIFGGAQFHVPDPATLNRFYAGAPIRQLWNGAFDYIPTIPVDGTLLRDETGNINVIFGGAQFHVPDPATLNRLYPGMPIHQLWNGVFDYIPTISVDRTLLRDENGAIAVIFGKAQFHVPDVPTLNLLFHGVPIDQLWNGAFDAVPLIPIDGTLLREYSNSKIYVIQGGRKVAAPTGVAGTVDTLWDGALSQIPS